MDRSPIIALLATMLLTLLAGVALADEGCVICHEDPKFKVQHRALWDYTEAFENPCMPRPGCPAPTAMAVTPWPTTSTPSTRAC